MFLQYREELYTAKRIKMTLNNEEINRYSRHLTLPEVGMEGQLKLKEAKVLMIGAGGLETLCRMIGAKVVQMGEFLRRGCLGARIHG